MNLVIDDELENALFRFRKAHRDYLLAEKSKAPLFTLRRLVQEQEKADAALLHAATRWSNKPC
jgi:hypothetical protein